MGVGRWASSAGTERKLQDLHEGLSSQWRGSSDDSFKLAVLPRDETLYEYKHDMVHVIR